MFLISVKSAASPFHLLLQTGYASRRYKQASPAGQSNALSRLSFDHTARSQLTRRAPVSGKFRYEGDRWYLILPNADFKDRQLPLVDIIFLL